MSAPSATMVAAVPVATVQPLKPRAAAALLAFLPVPERIAEIIERPTTSTFSALCSFIRLKSHHQWMAGLLSVISDLLNFGLGDVLGVGCNDRFARHVHF